MIRYDKQQMKNRIFRLVKDVFIIALIIFLFKVFYPVSYNVPLLYERSTTRYWNLSTGSRIGYTLIEGTKSKRPYPVIYLHGGPGGHVSDRDITILSLLANDGYDVYLYDQIGSGQSARLKNIDDYTVKRHIEDLREIIRQTGAEKVILIGQSWGAILATLFVADYPDKIEKIIFTSPGPIYPVQPRLASIPHPDSIQLKDPFFTNAEGNKIATNLRTKAMTFLATEFDKKLTADKKADEFATCRSYEVNRSTVCDTSKILPADAEMVFMQRS